MFPLDQQIKMVEGCFLWISQIKIICCNYIQISCNCNVIYLNDFQIQISRKFSNSNKILLGEDVLTITVQPGMDQAIVMALFMITKSMRWAISRINGAVDVLFSFLYLFYEWS
jgi:LURP-one-related